MFLNIQKDWIILKTYDQQFTLTTKKSLHIIFKPTLVHIPNGITIGSAAFAGLMVGTYRLTDQQTDHATPSVAINHI